MFNGEPHNTARNLWPSWPNSRSSRTSPARNNTLSLLISITPSAKIPARRDQAAEQFAVVEQALGDQVHHRMLALAFHLQLAGHAEQAAAEQKSALATRQFIEHHHVGAAGFVLQRDEDDAAGGARPLAAGDEPRAAHYGAVALAPRAPQAR